MSVATLHNVQVDYARGKALGPFSLEIAAGEIVALVGPSGCGKSTALRLLAGLEQPTTGDVTRAPGRGETAVVFQAPTLAPWLSARDNVRLGPQDFLLDVGAETVHHRQRDQQRGHALVQIGHHVTPLKT